ncbi:MAG: hypothetical protein JJT77_07750 [Crocinitomicaceae bacterium]|nr:hypothetical protein [Crocinitomicaceae bacterium]
MNSFFNGLILILCFISLPFALAVGLNEDFTFFGMNIPGEEFAFKDWFFVLVAILVFLLAATKASRKWSALAVVKQRSRFLFSSNLSNKRKNTIILFGGLEWLFILLVAAFFLVIAKESWVIATVLLIMLIEHVLHLSYGLVGHKFGIGMTSKAIVTADRSYVVIYFQGLKKVIKQQNNLLFDYGNNLVLELDLDIMEPKEQEAFIIELKKIANPKKVYYDGI